MANSNLAVDTSVIIDYFRKRNKRKSVLFQIVDDYTLHLPAVVEFELFAGATDPAKLESTRYLLQFFVPLPLTSAIAQLAGELYRQLKKENQLIEIRDLLIASTAMEEELPLVTLNRKHFQRIEGLDLQPLPPIR